MDSEIKDGHDWDAIDSFFGVFELTKNKYKDNN